MPRRPSGDNSIYLEGQVYVSRHERSSRLGDPSLARFLFIVNGDHYKGVEAPWEFLCATYPEAQQIAISEELRAEFDAWDAASDELSEGFSAPEA